MSAAMNAFIYDTFFKLMASHVVTFMLSERNVLSYVYTEADQSCSLAN